MTSPRAGLWLALLVPLSAAAESSSPETLLGCRSIGDDAQRLACYDRVVDRAREELTPEAPAQAPRASSSEPVAAANESDDDPGLRERLFGRPQEEHDRALRKSFGAEEAPESITSAVTAVTRGGDRRLTIALENGQTWKQEEVVSLALRAGDTVEIKSGLLGAYYLRKGGKGREIRVARLR